MNIFVVSDTHGRIDRAVELYRRVPAGISFDLLIHCGDHYRDAVQLSRELSLETVAVRGNCDGCFTREYKIVSAPSAKILVTHGHMEDVKFSLMQLIYLAREQECGFVCFGHTHIPVNDEANGIHLLNPGSISAPRDGTKGSAGLIVSAAKHTTASVIYY